MKSRTSRPWIVIAPRRALFPRAAASPRSSSRCACGAASTPSMPTASCFADPHFLADLQLFDRDRRRDHPRRHAARRADRLLDPPAPAAAAPDRRVHHAAAARHPGDRHRLRLSPPLQFARPGCRSPTSARATDLLLVFGYVTLALPYMYRAVDTGLRAIDVRTLTEAAQSLGAGWPTILFTRHPARTSASRCCRAPS